MKKTFNVKYDLQLNYKDNEGVEDLSAYVVEMTTADEYEELEEMRDWLRAKLEELNELADSETDAITYSKLLHEWDKTVATLAGVTFALELLEEQD